MPLSPGFRIKNCTQWPLTISLDQLGPLYYGLVQPGEIFQRDTGAVWFTIKALISPDNVCHVNDWDCVMPIATTVGAVLLGALTAGYGAFASVGASVGASALVSGGAVSMSSIVIPAAVEGGLTVGTAAGALGKIFSDGCDAKLMGCYAGPPWPFREDMPEYSVVGGPTARAENGKLVIESGPPLAIVEGFQPMPSTPKSTTPVVGLHVCGVTEDGHLWHTVRLENGNWTLFGDVEGMTGDIGVIFDVDCALHDDTLHVCAVTNDGRLYHAVRYPDGSWTPFGDVQSQTGQRGAFIGVTAAIVAGELQLCGITKDGRLWHTIRHADGSWDGFGDVQSQTGGQVSFTRVSSAGIKDEFHLAGVTSDGRLLHTIRHADGSWDGFGDVEAQTGDIGYVLDVSCASIGEYLHVCSTSSDGRLWHTIRTPNSWAGFGDVEAQAGDRGSFTRVDAAQDAGALHVSGITSDGSLWHTIRGEGWTPLGDVKSQAGNKGNFVSVSVAG